MTKEKTSIQNYYQIDSDRKFSYTKHKIADEFNAWGKYGTFHGIPIIFRAPKWPLKIFWLILFLIMLAVCVFTLYGNFNDFLQFGVSTVIRTTPAIMLRFPIVKVCNINFFVGKKADQYIKKHYLDEFNLTVNNFEGKQDI